MSCVRCASLEADFFRQDGQSLCRPCFHQDAVRRQEVRAFEEHYGLDPTGDPKQMRRNLRLAGSLLLVFAALSTLVSLPLVLGTGSVEVFKLTLFLLFLGLSLLRGARGMEERD